MLERMREVKTTRKMQRFSFTMFVRDTPREVTILAPSAFDAWTRIVRRVVIDFALESQIYGNGEPVWLRHEVRRLG